MDVYSLLLCVEELLSMTLFLIFSCVDVVSSQYSENKVTVSDSSPSVEIMLFQISSQVLDLTVTPFLHTLC